jgi:glucose/arabinose dehydrogenase
LFASIPAAGAILPGYRVEKIASVNGFSTSVAVTSTGTIYYTSTSGDIFRLDGATSVKVATLPTLSQGDAGLLGMALINDTTAAVHYTNPELTREIISRVNLLTGAETVVAEFIADMTNPSRTVSAEHHGGNPTVAPDGSIFVAIGDFGGGAIAADPAWTAGKVWRIHPDGHTEMFARGLRNVYDLAWDEAGQRLILADNGPVRGDEINVIRKGDFGGWPWTWGDLEPVGGSVAPKYVFPATIAPTGVAKLNDAHPYLRGYLFAGFMTAGIYHVSNIDADPFVPPVALLTRETSLMIDVTQAPNGDVIFATIDSIYRLVPPRRGDCNGDGVLDARDGEALTRELQDAEVQPASAVHAGQHIASMGCDANADGLVNVADRTVIARFGTVRPRAVRLR